MFNVIDEKELKDLGLVVSVCNPIIGEAQVEEFSGVLVNSGQDSKFPTNLDQTETLFNIETNKIRFLLSKTVPSLYSSKPKCAISNCWMGLFSLEDIQIKS